jgi:hypothetical protein
MDLVLPDQPGFLDWKLAAAATLLVAAAALIGAMFPVLARRVLPAAANDN